MLPPDLPPTDYAALMAWFSTPRPNGSAAEAAVRRRLQAWLAGHGVPCQVQTFRLYPYFFEALGLWLILSRTLLAAAVWLRWGWPALPIALAGLLGGALDWTFGLPLVTWPGARRGENLLAAFEPAAKPATQEVVLSAHTDSKTELLDHRQRAFFVRLLPLGMALTLLVGLLGLADGLLADAAPAWARAAHLVAAGLSLPLVALAWGLGLNLALGRLSRPSAGAVDNGAACAVLAGLAQRLAAGQVPLQRTAVTLAFFTGEEANLQGSRAYVRGRDWRRPALAVNLELLGQPGGYVYWRRDALGFRSRPTAAAVNAALAAAVQEVTGRPAEEVDLINSDAASFLLRGIPAAVLGTRHPTWGLAGLHRPSDSLDRVDLARLPEAVEILSRFLQQVDRAWPPAGSGQP
ncbi:MAG: M28 family metallopeptidase [Caldilineales bacterium]|nr:M28 family metallopeptidase [Caldilineales bacterium]MDW8319006.1 M20/M25/M40 family metallo-hydrolase [Anaerolineae bacterium]